MSEPEAPGKVAGKRGGKAAGETGREPDFEESLVRLEAIVARLEAGELPLEETLQLFEEGQGLVRTCGGLLERAEQRVKVLIEGTSETRDLVVSGTGSANAPGEAGGSVFGGNAPGKTRQGAADREGTDA